MSRKKCTIAHDAITRPEESSNTNGARRAKSGSPPLPSQRLRGSGMREITKAASNPLGRYTIAKSMIWNGDGIEARKERKWKKLSTYQRLFPRHKI